MKQKSLAKLLTLVPAALPIKRLRARGVTVCGIVATLIAFLPAAPQAQEWTGNVNALLGAKTLDRADWEPLEDQTEIGVLLDFKKKTWPVSIAIDFLQSEANETISDPVTGLGLGIDAETTEIDLGVRKIWDRNGKARPYIGGGLALISAELSAQLSGIRVSLDDDAEGYWINAGIYWTLAESFNIGLDLRYSQADVTFLGVDVNAGGSHAGLVLGYHW